MAKNVKDVHGILNSKGEREITLQKICDIMEYIIRKLMNVKI